MLFTIRIIKECNAYSCCLKTRSTRLVHLVKGSIFSLLALIYRVWISIVLFLIIQTNQNALLLFLLDHVDFQQMVSVNPNF